MSATFANSIAKSILETTRSFVNAKLLATLNNGDEKHLSNEEIVKDFVSDLSIALSEMELQPSTPANKSTITVSSPVSKSKSKVDNICDANGEKIPCQATLKSGKPCIRAAKYPLMADNRMYCGLHQRVVANAPKSGVKAGSKTPTKSVSTFSAAVGLGTIPNTAASFDESEIDDMGELDEE